MTASTKNGAPQEILDAFIAASRAISLSQDEPELLREFCLALVKYSGVLSASVGEDAGSMRFRPLAAVWGDSDPPRVSMYTSEDWDSESLHPCCAFGGEGHISGGGDCGAGELRAWEKEFGQTDPVKQVCIPVTVAESAPFVLRLTYRESMPSAEGRNGLFHRLADVLGVAISGLRSRNALAHERGQLTERNKELECLLALQKHFGGLGRVAADDWCFLVNRIPLAFSSPGSTGVRLRLGGEVYATDGSEGCCDGLSVEIAHNEEIYGSLCVCIGENTDLRVLPEEEKLLDSIASLVGAVIARTQARQQVEEFQTQLVATFEKTAAGIAHVSPDGSFIRVNPRFGEIAGWPGQTLVGKTFQEITHPDDLEKDLENVRHLVAGQAPHYSMRKRYLRKDRRIVWVNLTVSLVRDRSGNPDYFIAVIEDYTAIHQLEQHLQESRDRMAIATEAVNIGTFEWSPEEGEISWSRKAAELFGIEGEEGRISADSEWFQQIDVADGERLVTELRRKAGDTIAQVEYAIRSWRGGPERYVRTCARAIKVEGSGAERIIGIHQDITDRKKAEMKFSESEGRFRAVIEASPDGICICDPEGRFLDSNPTAARMLGYSMEDLKLCSVFDVDADAAANHEENLRFWRKTIEDGRTVTIETIHIRKDGSQYPAEVRVAPFSFRGKKGIIGMFRDISLRREAEKELKLRNSALNSAANSVVIVDRVGTIVWVNPAFCKVTGYTAEEVVGQNPRILKSGRQGKKFYQSMWKDLRAGREWKGSLVNRRKDGSEYRDEMTITPILDDSGEITHYIAIKEDVTERRQLEEQLRRAQRMESVGLLAGGIAHDLNNVLAPILLAVEMLRLEKLTPVGADVLDSLESSVERGAGIIRQVLTFARGSEGEKSLLQTRHLLKEIVKVARETFPRDINITGSFQPSLWPINGDPTQIHQVLLNLCVNARDAILQGGDIRIEASNEEIDHSLSYLNLTIPPGNYIRVLVRDNGSGMGAEVLDRIFDPFFTTKDKGKGTGLGLPTVLGIVRSHDGLIQVESELGKGSQFTVWFPAVFEAESEESDRVPAPEELPRGQGESILVVDDEPEILKLTTSILRSHGYQTEGCSDGTEALAKLVDPAKSFAAMVTDVMMPYMDGVTLVRSLRQMKKKLPVVVCSGIMDTDIASDRSVELEKLGVRTILTKPVKVKQLLEAVAEGLQPFAQQSSEDLR